MNKYRGHSEKGEKYHFVVQADGRQFDVHNDLSLATAKAQTFSK